MLKPNNVELHVYNGLFGSHMAFIMRRLRRICSAIGNNNVQFVSCSATVSNPEDVCDSITTNIKFILIFYSICEQYLALRM